MEIVNLPERDRRVLVLFANKASLLVLCINALFYAEDVWPAMFVYLEYLALASLLSIVLVQKYGQLAKTSHALPLYTLYLVGAIPMTSSVLCQLSFSWAYVLSLLGWVASFLPFSRSPHVLQAGAGVLLTSQIPHRFSTNGFVLATVFCAFCANQLECGSFKQGVQLRGAISLANLLSVWVHRHPIFSAAAVMTELFFNAVLPMSVVFLYQEKLKMQKVTAAS